MSPQAATGRRPSDQGRPPQARAAPAGRRLSARFPRGTGHPVSDGRASEGTVDAGRLMEEIKERVRERRASGFYSEDEVRRITQMEIELAESAPTFQDELEEHLEQLNDGWDTAAEPVIASHRAGVGAVIVAAKKLLRRVTRPYITLILARQVEFNSALLHLLNAFVLPVRDGLATLTRRHEDLSLDLQERLTVEHGERQRKEREVAERLGALTARVEDLRARGGAPAPARPGRGARAPAGRAAGPRRAPRRRPTCSSRIGTAGPARRSATASAPTSISSPARAACSTWDAGAASSSSCAARRASRPAASTSTPAMVARCREAGLAAEQADALAYLDAAARRRARRHLLAPR